MTGPAATAIVVSHNSEAHLGGSLAALRHAGLRVLLIDNASTDGTLRLVADEFPDVKTTANPVNVGFAKAVNQALRAVDSDVVLLVNPDCVVPAATARELIRAVRLGPGVGIAGPRLVGPGGRVAISAHPFESLTSVLASRFGGNLLPVAVRRLLCGAGRRRALARALIGIGLAGVRLPVAPAAGLARLRAWGQITRIAATARPDRLEVGRCTY